jgi:hypothetical protein
MQQEGMPAALQCRILLRECVLLQKVGWSKKPSRGSANQIKCLVDADYQQVWC